MADLSEATGDNRYLKASQKVWEDVVSGKIYITGGIGSKEYGEASGNHSSYRICQLTLRPVLQWRMYSGITGFTGRLVRQSTLTCFERTLYNGLISGIGSDGCHFFYPNPLESDGSFERAGWFECSCCPVNIARFMPQLEKYIWSENTRRHKREPVHRISSQPFNP